VAASSFAVAGVQIDRQFAWPEAQCTAGFDKRLCIGRLCERQARLVEILGDAGLGEEPMNLQCAKASVAKSFAAASSDNKAAPSFETMIATASNNTDGPPSIMCLASMCVPSAASTPPTLGAITSITAPSASMAERSSSNSATSAPSLSMTPILRPFETVGPVLDDAERRRRRQVIARRNGGFGRFGQVTMPSLSATVVASVSSMFNKCETIRSRIAGAWTLLSSNVSAIAM
jgi:hypothetical protein